MGEREVWEEGGDVGVSVEGRSCGRGEMLKRTRRHGSEGDVGRREEVQKGFGRGVVRGRRRWGRCYTLMCNTLMCTGNTHPHA